MYLHPDTKLVMPMLDGCMSRRHAWTAELKINNDIMRDSKMMTSHVILEHGNNSILAILDQGEFVRLQEYESMNRSYTYLNKCISHHHLIGFLLISQLLLISSPLSLLQALLCCLLNTSGMCEMKQGSRVGFVLSSLDNGVDMGADWDIETGADDVTFNVGELTDAAFRG